MLVPSIRICPQNLCRDWTSLMSLPNHVYLSPVFVLPIFFPPSLLFIVHSWQFVLRLEMMTKEWWVVGFVCCTDKKCTLFQEADASHCQAVQACQLKLLGSALEFACMCYDKWIRMARILSMLSFLILHPQCQWVKKRQRRSEVSACSYRI